MKQCIVVSLQNLRDHPSKVDLQIATVAGHQIVVGRHYDEGVVGIFIPDGAIIPDRLAEEMWLKGRLAGKNKDRVKKTERNGIVSEGLFYGSRFWLLKDGEKVYQNGPSWNPTWVEGQDVTKEIGVIFAKTHPSLGNSCRQCGKKHGLDVYCACGVCFYDHVEGISADLVEFTPIVVKCVNCGKENFWG